jgi:hypothetical protein
MKILGYYGDDFVQGKYAFNCHQAHQINDYEILFKEFKKVIHPVRQQLSEIIEQIVSIPAEYYEGKEAPFYYKGTGNPVFIPMIMFSNPSIFNNCDLPPPSWVTGEKRVLSDHELPPLPPKAAVVVEQKRDSSLKRAPRHDTSLKRALELQQMHARHWGDDETESTATISARNSWSPIHSPGMFDGVTEIPLKPKLSEIEADNKRLEARIAELEIQRALKRREELERRIAELESA